MSAGGEVLRPLARAVQAGAEERFPFTPVRKATALGGKEEVSGAEQLLAKPQLLNPAVPWCQRLPVPSSPAPGVRQHCCWQVVSLPGPSGFVLGWKWVSY